MVSIFYHLDVYKETLSQEKQGESEDTERYMPSPYEKLKETDNERSANRSTPHNDEDDDEDDDEDFEENEDDINGESIFKSFLED